MVSVFSQIGGHAASSIFGLKKLYTAPFYTKIYMRSAILINTGPQVINEGTWKNIMGAPYNSSLDDMVSK